MTILSVLVGWAAPNLVSILSSELSFFLQNYHSCLFITRSLKGVILSWHWTWFCIYWDMIFSVDAYDRCYLTLVWPYYLFYFFLWFLPLVIFMLLCRSRVIGLIILQHSCSWDLDFGHWKRLYLKEGEDLLSLKSTWLNISNVHQLSSE